MPTGQLVGGLSPYPRGDNPMLDGGSPGVSWRRRPATVDTMTTTLPSRMSLLAILSLVLACLLLAVPGSSSAAPSERSSDPAERAITAQYQNMAAVPAAYAVIDGGRTLFGGQHGAGADTPFIVGSVSKSFTALTVLVQVQQGVLDLDSPVNRYLPDLRLERAGEQATLRHLLSHTAGVGRADCNKDVERTYGSVAARVEDMREVQVQSIPGASFEYCNVGYAILARIVEVETGQPFADVLRGDVLEPLGLTETYTDHRQAKSAGLAEGRATVMGFPFKRPEHMAEATLPDGSLISTVRDLAAYARFQMGGGTTSDGRRLLSSALMKEMHTVQVEVPGLPPEMAGYGMGWFVGADQDRTVVWHGGTTYRYQADVAMLPEEGRAVVSLAAGQWLAGTRPLTEASISGLLDRETEPSNMYLISTTGLWLASAALVGTVVASLLLSRRRRAIGRRPRLWAAVLLTIAAGLLPVVLVMPAIQELGSLARALRFGLQAAPDLLVLEVSWVVALLWIGIKTWVDRRGTPALSVALTPFRVPSLDDKRTASTGTPGRGAVPPQS